MILNILKMTDFRLCFFLLFAVFFSFAAKSQGNLRINTLGGSAAEVANAITMDNQRNIFVTGSFKQQLTLGNTTLVANGDEDVFLTCLDSINQPIWAKSFGSISSDNGKDILFKNGFIYTVGSFWDNIVIDTLSVNAGSGGSAIYVSKWNSDGHILWAKALRGNGVKTISDVAVDDLGNVIVTGDFSINLELDTNHMAQGNIDGFMVKYDAGGYLIWANTFGLEGNTSGKHLATDALGNIYSVGEYNRKVQLGDTVLISGANDINGWLGKWSPAGQMQWVRALTGVGDIDLGAVVLSKNDVIFVGGHYQNSLNFGNLLIQTPAIDFDIFIGKYTTDGLFLEGKTIGDVGNSFFSAMDLGDNHLFYSGYSLSNAPINTRAFTAFQDTILTNDETILKTYYSDTDFENTYIADVLATETPTGSGWAYYAIGNFNNTLYYTGEPLPIYGNGGTDFFISYLTAIFGTPTNAFPLLPSLTIFPNPTNDFLQIKTTAQNGKISVLNALGQHIFSTDFKNNTHEIAVKGWAKGVYFLTIQSSEGGQTAKAFVVE